MLVRLIVDNDLSKSIVVERDVAKRVAELLEMLGHSVMWSDK